MLVSYELDSDRKLTPEQEQMLIDASKQPIVFEEECPELTDEELAEFYRVSEKRREERRKQTVTLRLSPQAFYTAKSLGKGYTSVLSRILENALKDKDTIQRYL
ncbi:MAG: BrnA antitoxin family protein [Clostridiales bacterium]|nr:BrnA antitoxin family protein [Clostridiales bacterium]